MFYKTIFLFFSILLFPIFNCYAVSNDICDISADDISHKLAEIKANRNFIRSLSDCESANRQIISAIINLDYRYFYYAADSIKDDEVFIKHFIKQNPDILVYLSHNLKNSKSFIFSAIKIYPDILKYVSPKLLDNKMFMIKMIKKNPKNFIYASSRLQNNYDLVLLAVMGDGKMLEYASKTMRANKTIVTQAVKSYTPAIYFAKRKIRKNTKIQQISESVNYNFLKNFTFFLKENYAGLPVGPKGIRGYRIVNKGKFFADRKIINNPYFIQWQATSKDNSNQIARGYKLVNTNNKYIGWKMDLQNYSGLIKQIEEIFIYNQLDQNTIDVLTLTSLWKVSDKPEVLAFNLYLLRNIKDRYLRPNLTNITSFTAIAKKDKNQDIWLITIVNALFDIDTEVDIRFKNGYRKYVIWDLYKYSEEDSNPKILFKIEGQDAEDFELFIQQPNGKYVSFYKGGGYNIDNY